MGCSGCKRKRKKGTPEEGYKPPVPKLFLLAGISQEEYDKNVRTPGWEQEMVRKIIKAQSRDPSLDHLKPGDARLRDSRSED